MWYTTFGNDGSNFELLGNVQFLQKILFRVAVLACLPVFCLEIGGVVGQVRRQQKIKAASKVVVQHKIAKKSINPKIVVGQSHASGT